MESPQIDPLAPDLRLLSTLVNRLENRPCPATTWRWQTKGSNGTRLETLKIAGRIYTTETEFRRFIAATQDRKTEPKPTDHDAVERQLKKRGYDVPKC